jgi:hypothetical protein
MRNDRTNSDRKLQIMSVATDASEFFLGQIHKRYKPYRHAVELLARLTGAKPRAAKNWLDGVNPPCLDSAVNLLVEDDECFADFVAFIESKKCRVP